MSDSLQPYGLWPSQVPLSIEFFQVRILEWVVISFFRRSSRPKNQIHVSCVSCIDSQVLYQWETWEFLIYFISCLAGDLGFIQKRSQMDGNVLIGKWSVERISYSSRLASHSQIWSDICVYIDICIYWYVYGFPDGASGKEPICQCRKHKTHGFTS